MFWQDCLFSFLFIQRGQLPCIMSRLSFKLSCYKNCENINQNSMKTSDPIKIKLIVVGDSGVGKSSILLRFTHGRFDEFSEPTLGAAFIAKQYTLPDGRKIQFHLWDTAGQQKYRSIAPIYYKQARIALCVYDICSQNTFEVMKKWVNQLKESGPEDIVLAVVGNKIDKYDEEEVNYSQVKQYAEQNKAILKLVSAKQGKNIQNLFGSLAQEVVGVKNVKKGNSLTESENVKKKSRCC